MDKLRIRTTIPLDRARTFNEIAKLAGMDVPKHSAPAHRSSDDDAVVKALRDGLLRSVQAKPTLGANALYDEMMKRAGELHPGDAAPIAFRKSLDDPTQRATYAKYRTAWRDEVPAREAAVEKHREAERLAKRQAVEKFEAGHGPAYRTLMRKGEELRQMDPILTREQAFAKAVRENPDLWRRYREESRAA